MKKLIILLSILCLSIPVYSIKLSELKYKEFKIGSSKNEVIKVLKEFYSDTLVLYDQDDGYTNYAIVIYLKSKDEQTISLYFDDNSELWGIIVQFLNMNELKYNSLILALKKKYGPSDFDCMWRFNNDRFYISHTYENVWPYVAYLGYFDESKKSNYQSKYKSKYNTFDGI